MHVYLIDVNLDSFVIIAKVQYMIDVIGMLL